MDYYFVPSSDLKSSSSLIGYPLRSRSPGGACHSLIQLSGVPVIREGAVLSTGGELVVIDAPCSGAKMLWTGMYLDTDLCCLYRLSTFPDPVAGTIAMTLVILGNVLTDSGALPA